jgi:hypothetical protein
LPPRIDRLTRGHVTCDDPEGGKTDARVIPAETRVRSTAHIDGLEWTHGRPRHWCGRCPRKSVMVSKATAMVDLTRALCARVRVNGPVAEICTLDMMT